MLQLSAAGATMLCHDVLAVFEVDECPELRVCSEDDVTASSAVASVRTSLRDVLLSSHVSRSCATIARAAIYLYVVYEITICHNLLFFFYIR